MNKYYLHDGTENIGPFDIEELKPTQITELQFSNFNGKIIHTKLPLYGIYAPKIKQVKSKYWQEEVKNFASRSLSNSYALAISSR